MHHNVAKCKNRCYTSNFDIHVFTLQDKLRHILKLSIGLNLIHMNQLETAKGSMAGLRSIDNY